MLLLWNPQNNCLLLVFSNTSFFGWMNLVHSSLDLTNLDLTKYHDLAPTQLPLKSQNFQKSDYLRKFRKKRSEIISKKIGQKKIVWNIGQK